MKMTKLLNICCITACLLATLAPSLADAHFDHYRVVRAEPRHFVVRDVGLWRRGHWFHGNYAGSLGWWWVVGTTWYFYQRPIYPYPETTVAPVYYVEAPATPAVVLAPAPAPAPVPTPSEISSPPPAAPPVALTAPPSSTPPVETLKYYYCSNPAGYYPNITNCPGGWTAVSTRPVN
jgi:hypothetical protein